MKELFVFSVEIKVCNRSGEIDKVQALRAQSINTHTKGIYQHNKYLKLNPRGFGRKCYVTVAQGHLGEKKNDLIPQLVF